MHILFKNVHVHQYVLYIQCTINSNLKCYAVLAEEFTATKIRNITTFSILKIDADYKCTAVCPCQDPSQ